MNPNNLKGCPTGNPGEVIVSAAINFDGIIICAPRHIHCLEYAEKYYGHGFVNRTTKTNSPQGFIANRNRFVDRVEAMKIARTNNQVPENIAGDILFSEDLY